MRNPASTSFPPAPSVEHLTTLFRRIDAGKIVIPAFQRTFVWERGQVLALLESVYLGYPIGSLLLWSVEKETLKPSDAPEIPFPHLELSYPVSFVLDGLQRLSTLYGAFHHSDESHNKIFDVRFDLSNERFLHGDDLRGDGNGTVPISALFNPRRLLEEQRKIIEAKLPDQYVETAIDLQSRFQEYMVPLVTLSERDIEEVVTIFERVNSTGLRLSRVDFMRAITWSAQFDLNDALDKIDRDLEDVGFEIDDDTLVKALGLTFGLDPLPDVLLHLKDQSPINLHAAVDVVSDVFVRVFTFLGDTLGIHSREFVPYEGQLLVLFEVFKEKWPLSAASSGELKRWFHWISIEEVLQGRPDHFVVRMIRTVREQLENGRIEIPAQRIEPSRLIRRRLLRGKALTAAVVTLLAEQGVRDLSTGKLVPPEVFTRSYRTNQFLPVFAVGELPENVGAGLISAKVPANVVLVAAGQNLQPSDVRIKLLEAAERDDSEAILRSHLITPEALQAIRDEDATAFLKARGEALSDLISSIILVEQ